MRGAILRLQRRVRDKRIGIGGFHNLRRALQSAVRIAVLAKRLGGRLLGKFHCPLREPDAGLRRAVPFIPFHLQLLARRLGLPPAIGDNGDPRLERVRFHDRARLHVAFHDKCVADAGHGFDFVQIRAHHLAREHRALLVHGEQHVRQE